MKSVLNLNMMPLNFSDMLCQYCLSYLLHTLQVLGINFHLFFCSVFFKSCLVIFSQTIFSFPLFPRLVYFQTENPDHSRIFTKGQEKHKAYILSVYKLK